jgi:hypothetical protein
MPPITIDISAKVPTGGLSRIRLRSSSVILSISVSLVIIESISLYNLHGKLDEKFSVSLSIDFYTSFAPSPLWERPALSNVEGAGMRGILCMILSSSPAGEEAKN